MKVVIYAFTKRGRELAGRVKTLLMEARQGQPGGFGALEIICRQGAGALQTVQDEWKEAQLFLFISAAGIAVRTVAPLLENKLTDPAVLVLDEMGTYVIPILSGHYGGGNEFAVHLAGLLDACPVVTTATDLHGKFAVDVFARKNNLSVLEKGRIKWVSSAILRGETVGISAETGLQGQLPEGLVEIKMENGVWQASDIRIGIYIGREKKSPFTETLHLVPRSLIVGMGCRKGKSFEELKGFLQGIFYKYHLELAQIRSIHSIDVKKNEQGLVELARQLHVPFLTFSAEQLSQAKGSFMPSEFVSNAVGVDNVCERSAAFAAGDDYVWVLHKYALDGMTAAIVRINTCISF